jgi:ankyrin repeat protein
VTALLIAVAENNKDMVRRLLQLKADQTVRTDGGLSALDIARAKGNESIITLLGQARPETGR